MLLYVSVGVLVAILMLFCCALIGFGFLIVWFEGLQELGFSGVARGYLDLIGV